MKGDDVLDGVIVGIISGVLLGGSGYFKTHKKDKFDKFKLGSTIVLSATVGGYLSYIGIPVTETAFATAMTSMTTMGITAFVENILKGIWRKLKGR